MEAFEIARNACLARREVDWRLEAQRLAARVGELEARVAMAERSCQGLFCSLVEGHDLVGDGLLKHREWREMMIAEVKEALAALKAGEATNG